MKPKPKKVYRHESLTSEECLRLFDVCEKFEDVILFKLALTTGIRREDIVGIETGNVDLESRSIKFWQAKKQNWHVVPIHSELLPELTRYLNNRTSERLLFDFTGKTAYNRLQKYVKKAGIRKHLRFHDLRRSFVKLAKKRGISIKAVSQILDDKIDTVEEFYANMDTWELGEELDRLEVGK